MARPVCHGMVLQLPISLLSIGLALALSPLSINAQILDSQAALNTALEQISGERMRADVTSLSKSFNGRQAGTDDDLTSAQWVGDRFLKFGLRMPTIRNYPLTIPSLVGKDGTSSGLMATFITTSRIDPDPSLRISAGGDAPSRRLGAEYLPVFDSPSAGVQGPIVFVGYGIADQANGLNDYDGVDVHNCVVLFLRGKPDYYQPPISHADKVRIATQKGAIGYLTATGPVLNAYEARRGITGTPSAFYGMTDALPGAWISTALAEEILADPPQTGQLRTRQEQLNKAPISQALRTGRFGSLSWNTKPIEGLLTNVLASIPGSDAYMGQDAVVIGAHRDHFGIQAGLVFPGADDNASGTAVMLEVARILAMQPVHSKRTILFISFSGEERGLLGSRLYVGRPVVSLDSTKAMINIDHASIGNGRLTVGVTGLEKSLAQEAGQLAGLADKLDLFGFFPGGDHVPFKEAGVPTVTVVSGGVHPHFHQPTDTAETVSAEILTSTARYVLALAWQLANAP